MTAVETPGLIDALERARAELERALQDDAHWRALRQGAPGADRSSTYEQALAGNLLYRCWEQLNQAVADLRIAAAKAAVEPKTSPQTPSKTLSKTPRKVGLREILEQIRSDPGLGPSKPAPAAPDGDGMGSPPAAPLSDIAAAMREDAGAEAPIGARETGPAIASIFGAEASVSFVIREPAYRPRRGDEHRRQKAGASAPGEAAEADAELGAGAEPAEAKVTIVPIARR